MEGLTAVAEMLMPFDEDLAARVRELFERQKGVVEKKMFGGVGWMLNGNMCVGVWKDSLIARVGAEDTDAALAAVRKNFGRD